MKNDNHIQTQTYLDLIHLHVTQFGLQKSDQTVNRKSDLPVKPLHS